MKIYKHIKALLEENERFFKDGELFKNVIVEASLKLDPELLALLLADEEAKKTFFTTVNDVAVFDKIQFQQFISNKQFLPDSYTAFKNKIGLTANGDYLTEAKEVVLDFPYKDCVLEGGQTKDEQKRQEIFWNETLAPDEIDRLLEPKVLSNWKRIRKGTNCGKIKTETPEKLEREADGTLKDNLMIKGNNLIALHSLKKVYKGKVKLIYIDPPYNTGNDSFNYNDNFNHSTWLTFMKNRLEVARELLRDDGVIFVQCDDNEQAYLKVLMDGVFGRENFIGSFIWKKKNGGGNDSKHIVIEHESILSFSKNTKAINEWHEEHDDKYLKRYKEEDENGKYFWDTFARPGLRSPINYNIEIDDEIINGDWIWSEKRFLAEREKGEIKFQKNNKNTWTVFFKQRLNNKGKKTRSLIIEKGNSSIGTKEILDLFSRRVFATPKPEVLINHLVYITTQPNDIVLDYHLGSGTTAAVAHKMGRRYIGVEQMDYVEDIAVERLKKVIDGEQGGISKSVDWQGGGSFVYCELAQNTEIYKKKIQEADDKQAVTLWQELQENPHISHRVDFQKTTDEEFLALSLENKQEILKSIIDKNMLYIPFSDMESTDYKISDGDKKLTQQFYK